MNQGKIDDLVKDLEALEVASEHLKESKLLEIKEAIVQFKNKHGDLPHLPMWFTRMVEGENGGNKNVGSD